MIHSTYLICICICLLAIIHTTHAHYEDPRAAAFPITPSTDKPITETVNLPAVQGPPLATCKFTYQTGASSASPVEPTVKTTPPPHNLASIFQTLQESNTCVTSTIGYWNYKACFGAQGTFEQSHSPDVYLLGQHPTYQPDSSTMLFTSGAICEGRADRPHRQVTVKFACIRNNNEPRLISIEEPSMCSYNAVIGLPALCAFSQFPEVSAPVTVSTNIDTFVDDGHEDWFIQISQVGKHGDIACSVFTTENKYETESKLHFSQFKLDLIINDSQSQSNRIRTIARKPHRRPISTDEYQVSGLTVSSNKEHFRGQLEFLQVSTQLE